MKNAVQVCADHRAPPFFFHAHQQRVAGRTRVIDQDVDSAQLLFNHLHQLGGFVKTAHICLKTSAFAAGVTDGGGRRGGAGLIAAVVQGDARAP